MNYSRLVVLHLLLLCFCYDFGSAVHTHRFYKGVGHPSDISMLQLDAKQEGTQAVQEKFIGDILWSAFDLVTFGVFEKKGAKAKRD